MRLLTEPIRYLPISTLKIIIYVLGLDQDADIGIGKDILPISDFCNSQKTYMSTENVKEIQRLLKMVRPFLDDSKSFKIILLLLLTESEYSPSFKRLHTAFASAILRNASGSDRGENEILGPYFNVIQKSKRINQLIQDYVQDFTPSKAIK